METLAALIVLVAGILVGATAVAAWLRYYGFF